MNKRRFLEFFAGGGMARAGLEPGWECTFANDFSLAKSSAYCINWGGAHFVLCDVNDLTIDQLPDYADLAWASFPCQDLSLAGDAAGLGTIDHQTRSGAFWAFWRLIQQLASENRAPALVVLENVYGALTSNGGRDFAAICTAIAAEGYLVGSMVIDAKHFVPQSRPRLFIVGIRHEFDVPDHLVQTEPNPFWHPKAMQSALSHFDTETASSWRWLSPPKPQFADLKLDRIMIDDPDDVRWHSQTETSSMLAKMSHANLAKLEQMKQRDRPVYGTVYRRTRPLPNGQAAVRAELRDDGIAGCLRTPGGGSSRQFVIRVDGESVRTRLLSAREAARLMGLSDLYQLPLRYNDAYHLMGDGVVVPVVEFLDQQLLRPILDQYDEPLLMAAE